MLIARSNVRKLSKILLFVLSLLPLIWLCFAIYSDTYFGTRILTANPIQKLDRELGDWGLIFLILTLCVRPLAEVFNFGGLIIYRRMLGLFAFFYVCLHLLSYLFLKTFNFLLLIILHCRLEIVLFLNNNINSGNGR